MTKSGDATDRFDVSGTLPRPGMIGRLVRLAMGALCLWACWQMLFRADAGSVDNIPVWIWFVFALWLLPPVVNIGWGRLWHRWPMYIGAIATVLAAAGSYWAYDTVLAPPLWWVMKTVMSYAYGHLGISFVLSSVLATPGCEMRAIPHLVGIVAGRPSREHYCPGFIDTVDRWEARLKEQ